MVKKDLRSENDNLKLWRGEKAFLTGQLLKKSLEELIKLKAVINQKTVCEMMDKLADETDKEYKVVISPSAISKNKVYKNMILEAKEKVQLSDDRKKSYQLDGDTKLEIFQLKTIIAKKEAKIKELESIIARANIQKSNEYKINDKSKEPDYKEIIKGLVKHIRNYQSAYYDDANNLIDEDTHNILISSSIMDKLDA